MLTPLYGRSYLIGEVPDVGGQRLARPVRVDGRRDGSAGLVGQGREPLLS